MNSLDIKVETLIELDQAAVKLIHFFDDYKIILFDGQMGSGKTTLIKSICKSLGSISHFSSPTYSIVNEYAYPNGKIFHFDLYRLTNDDELYDLGIEEYLQSNEFCFVEWPQKMMEHIDSKYIKIEINLAQNIRYIRASKILA